MVNFALGVYVFGFILAFIMFWFLTMLGGKSKSKANVFGQCWMFAMLWPISIWFLNKL